MTDQPEPLAEAIEDRDVTLALTPAQLILVVVGVWLLVRLLRRRRG
jgi:hypothetical protein